MRKVKIGDFLHRIKRPIKLNPNSDYNLVTIRVKHKGVTLRGSKKGFEIKSKMYQVKEGDFILSGIDARNGAFGIIPKELDGAIVTNDFWYFELDEKIIDKHFFLELTATSWFDEICRLGSDGTTQRIRLQKDKFFNQEIFLPTLEEQQKFVSKFISFKSKNNIILDEIQTQQTLLKQLRQSILQEAIEGKLTISWREKNPNIESATHLLEKIKAEKERLIKEKKIKKQKALAPIDKSEVPFDIPNGWVWCRLGEVTSKIGAGSTPRGSNYADKGIYFFRSQNIYNEGLVYKDIKYISKETHKKMAGTKIFAEDILLNITGGSMGRCAYVPKKFNEANINQHVCIIRPILFNSIYLHKLILSPIFQKMIFSSTTGAGREGLPKNNLEQFIIPLPPLEEQKQIVKKIEILFSLCDKLEEQINTSKKSAEMLMQSVLKEAFGE